MIVVATKSEAEREDEEAERLVRNAPKDKPPRRDRRREQVEVDRDLDVEVDPDLKGKDTSLNYKNVGGSTVERLSLRFLVRIAGRRSKPKGKRKGRIPARSRETGEAVLISPETLKTKPGKYEKIDPEEKPAPSAGQPSPDKVRKPKRPRGKQPKVEGRGTAPAPSPQLVKRNDEPSDDDHEYEEVELDDEKGGEKKEESKPKDGQGDKGKGKDTKSKGSKGEKPLPEPSVADKLGIKTPKLRETSAQERAEVALLLADTLPPALAARLIAKGIHPDDAKTVISSYKAASTRPIGNPGEFAAKAAKVFQTDPDKVEPPTTWRTADGKKVAFEELTPDDQATAYRQHQMQVIAVSLAAREQLEKKLSFDGVVPPNVARALVATLLGQSKLKEAKPAEDGPKDDGSPKEKTKPDEEATALDTPERVFEAITASEGFVKIPEGLAKHMMASVKDNDDAKALVQAILEGNDYKRAKDLYLGKGMFSERDDPKQIAKGLKSARDFFKVRGAAYGSDGHDGAKRFETKVLAKLRMLEPEKYQKVRHTLDREDARTYEVAAKAYRMAREKYGVEKEIYDKLPPAERGEEPKAPVAPIEPAGYSNAKKPEDLKREGRDLWDDLFERSGKKKTAATVASRYLISSYLHRVAMVRTTNPGTKRALYHGIDPAVNYPREPYPGPTQVPSRTLAELDDEKILASAREWLDSPVLTQGMTGLESEQISRFALDLALSDGVYRLDATTYDRLLARLQGITDPGSVLVEDLFTTRMGKTAKTLEEQIFGKFPPDSRSKSGGRFNVLLTGATAKILRQPAYTTVALGDLPAADLQKLAETLKVKAASSSFASAGEATSSTTSIGRPITETVNMLRLSSDQKNQANSVLSTLDKTAQMIQDNAAAWGIPFKAAKAIVNQIDKAADVTETLVFGDQSLRSRQAEIAVSSDDFEKEATSEGLLSRAEFAKAAKVIQRDSDEGYMDTFKSPMRLHETDGDEPYMTAYNDDQSSAVSEGEDETGRALAP